MTGTLYTIGYRGLAPRRFAALLPQGIEVVDVRLKPWSWDATWGREIRRTMTQLGMEYHQERGLGNKAYKTGGVEIADLSRLVVVLERLRAGRDVALLCACSDPHECHRMVLADALGRLEPGLRVIHRVGSDPDPLPDLGLR